MFEDHHRDYKNHIVTNVKKYINNHVSKRLLDEGSLKVYEVADMLGFESSFYFSKVFKKLEGISPSDYANRAAGT